MDSAGIPIAVLESMGDLACPASLRPLYEARVVQAVASHYRHELGNTLGAISSSVFFLRRRLKKEAVLDADPRIESSLSLMETRVRDAAARLETPLGLGPDRPGRDLVVSTVAQHLIEKLAAPPSVQIVLTEPSPLVVQGRDDELELVLFCLIQNAVEAVSAKGAGEVRIHVALGSTRYFEVDDDGLGLPETIADSTMSAFVTTKPGRLGLGLCIARQLAEHIGGMLDIDRSDRGGVRARVTIR